MAHIMTPYRPLTSHYVQEHLGGGGGGSTRVFSGGHTDIERWLRARGGTPHVKFSPISDQTGSNMPPSPKK